MPRTVLVVDDDSTVHTILSRRFAGTYTIVSAYNGRDGLEALRARPDIDAILLDMLMPHMGGKEVLAELRTTDPDLPVVVLTGEGSIEGAVEAMQLGAFNYLVKPIDLDKLVSTLANAFETRDLKHEVRNLREAMRERYAFDNAVGASRAMQQVFRIVHQVLEAKAPVLLTGESGTGKEVLARVLHFNSARAQQPFVAVNCAAIPEELLESELFGHERGSFTGAQQRRIGKFQEARSGTILLDEIAELAPRLQAKLLRVLQERTFERVGSNTTIRVDARIIAATNRDLTALIANGRFREDLYYRLNVLSIELPPLRDRLEDVPLLTHHMLKKAREREGVAASAVDPDAMSALQCYPWPGNVRELENVMMRAAIVATGRTVALADLPPAIRDHYRAHTSTMFSPVVPQPRLHASPAHASPAHASPAHASPAHATPVAARPAPTPVSRAPEAHDATRTLHDLELEALRAALAVTPRNLSRVARQLGIGRATLYRKLHRYADELGFDATMFARAERFTGTAEDK